jgi:hypothetical protein
MVSLMPIHFFMLAGASLPLDPAEVERALSVRVVIAKSTRRPPYLSGVFAVWARVETRDDAGNEVTAYLPYIFERQSMPRRGEICLIHYHLGEIDGLVGRTGTQLRSAPVIDQLQCGDRNNASFGRPGNWTATALATR